MEMLPNRTRVKVKTKRRKTKDKRYQRVWMTGKMFYNCMSCNMHYFTDYYNLSPNLGVMDP